MRVEPPREPGVERDGALEHGLGLVLAERERLEDAADLFLKRILKERGDR